MATNSFIMDWSLCTEDAGTDCVKIDIRASSTQHPFQSNAMFKIHAK